MDQQQNSQNIQAPATPTAVPNPPVVPSPTPPNPPPSSPPPQNPPPSPPPTPIRDKPASNLSKYIKIFSIVTIYIAAAVLSYFFYTNQRQPKTSSRAATPSPTISIFAPTVTSTPVTATGNLTPSPTASSSGSFGKIVTPPTPTPKPAVKIPSIPRQTIEITAAANTFTPNQLSAELNQIVTIIITASDKDYDFTLPVFGISKTFPKGTRGFVEFQATSEGVFYFSCQTTCGNNPSATGTLTVK